jgi:hypothetical protein
MSITHDRYGYDQDYEDGDGDVLVSEAHALLETIQGYLMGAQQRGHTPELALMTRLYLKSERRYWRRVAAIQPAQRADCECISDDDLPF